MLALAWPAVDGEVVQRVRERIEGLFLTLPDYVCSEKIERVLTGPAVRQPLPPIRVEIGYIGGREFYAWPGGRFDEGVARHLLNQQGAVGNGAFADQLHVFWNVADFTAAGEEERKRESMLRLDFRVPRVRSRYRLGRTAATQAVGYSGTLWVRADTLDPVRLEIAVDDIPPGLEITSASQWIEYATVPVAGRNVPLPSMSELAIGIERNRGAMTRFSFDHCRRFTGESTIRFAEPR